MFSDEIDNDPWTLFHGTCGNLGTVIDDKGITPTHTLSGGELTGRLNIIIDLIYETINTHLTPAYIPKSTLNNYNGLIVRKSDATVYESGNRSRILIYLFLDNNSVVSWVVDVDISASSEATSADIQQLDLVAQKATTTQPKQEYEPAVTYTEEEYNAVVTQRDARPTQADYDAVVGERDSRLTEKEVRDLRLGSTMLEVVNGDASINIELEATDNLGITNPT